MEIKRKQLSTTFTEHEVTALLFVAKKLQAGGDPGMVVRLDAWHKLVGKFQKLDAKAKLGEFDKGAQTIAAKRERGERVGAVPYGSQLAADGKTLEPNEYEQRVIEFVRRERRDSGLSTRRIAMRLTLGGYEPRSGGVWHPQMIGRMLGAK